MDNLSGYLFFLLTILYNNIHPAYAQNCEFDTCLNIYHSILQLKGDPSADPLDICDSLDDLKSCNKELARKCRGDLNYHFFEKLVRDLLTKNNLEKNCTLLAVAVRLGNGESRSSNGNHNGRNLNDSSSPNSPRKFHIPPAKGGVNKNYADSKCISKYNADTTYVGCSLFGLTNLKSFSQHLNSTDINSCALSGAWSLIDTPEFAVQITNKDGLRPLAQATTTTTLVTVIIKGSQCSERKTYQATFDEVPSMFSDGKSVAGNVYIDTVEESEHVQIVFSHINIYIDVIKVIDRLPIPSLSVAIKMPQDRVDHLLHSEKYRGIPLCLYGCPRAASKSRSSNANIGTMCENYRSIDEEEDESSMLHHSENEDRSISQIFSESSGSPDVNINNFGEEMNPVQSMICASFRTVEPIFFETTVIDQKLALKGEKNFGSSTGEATVEQYSVQNSALTSQSGRLFYSYHSLAILGIVLLFFGVR